MAMQEHVNADAPGNIDHLRNPLDMGLHEFFERDFDHDVKAVETTDHEPRRDFTKKAVEVREQIGKIWNTGQAVVTANPVKAWNAIDGQRCVSIRNIGSNPVFVGPNGGQATGYGGYQVDAGASITLDINADVWVSSPSGSTVCFLAIALGSLS